MEVLVQFSAKLPVKITKKRKWVVASCPILDVHSQGETVSKARKNLGEALTLFFTSCFERGTLDAVLKECGFKALHPPIPPKKEPTAKREDYIKVPIPFLVQQDASASCHA